MEEELSEIAQTNPQITDKEPKIANTEQSEVQKSNLREWLLKNKKYLLGAGASILGIGLVVLAAKAVDEDSGKDTYNPSINTSTATETIAPTPNQTTEVTPIPTTPSQTETPTTSPTIQETPSRKTGIWDIETQYSAPSHFRTIEQDQAILNTVMEKFPHIGNVKVILTSGESSATYVDPDLTKPIVIYAGRDAYDYERKLYNEFARVFDVRQPETYQRLAIYYSPEQLDQMKGLSDQIVEKWRNYPSIEKMFAPDKTGQTTKNHFTAYSDAIFIQQSIDLSVPGHEWRYPLSEPIFEKYLNMAPIEQIAQPIPQEQWAYTNFPEFYNAQKEQIDQLKSSDPTHKLAITILEENLDSLGNWQWSSTQNVKLDTKYLKDYYLQILPTYEQIALLSALGENDPRLTSIFTSDQIQDMRANYQALTAEADRELQDTVYEQVLMGTEHEELINQYHQIVWSIFR